VSLFQVIKQVFHERQFDRSLSLEVKVIDFKLFLPLLGSIRTHSREVRESHRLHLFSYPLHIGQIFMVGAFRGLERLGEASVICLIVTVLSNPISSSALRCFCWRFSWRFSWHLLINFLSHSAFATRSTKDLHDSAIMERKAQTFETDSSERIVSVWSFALTIELSSIALANAMTAETNWNP